MKFKKITSIMLCMILSSASCVSYAKTVSRENSIKYETGFDWSKLKTGITKNDEDIYFAKQIIANYSYEYFRNEYESNPKIIVDLLNKEAGFASNVDSYVEITEKIFEDEETKTNYYYDVLIGLITNEDFNDPNINTIENNRYILIKENLDNKISENSNVDLLKDINTSKDILENLGVKSDTFKNLECLDKLLVACDTIDAFNNEISAIMALDENVEDKILFLNKLKENNEDNKALCNAVDKINEKIEIAKNETIYKYIDTLQAADREAYNVLKAALYEKMAEVGLSAVGYGAWEISVDGTALAMNTIFGIDEICESYLKLSAMAEIENTMKKVIENDINSFKNDSSVENAKIVIAEADYFKAIELYGADLAIEYADAVTTGGIYNRVQYLFDNEKKEFVETLYNIKEIIKDESFTDDEFKDLDTIISAMYKDDTIPDYWAVDEIKEAKDLGIFDIENGYKYSISRAEFCKLICFTLEGKGYNINQLIKEKNGRLMYSPFSDTRYKYVDNVYRLGIINGLGDNSFNPLGNITRQEAAVMLKNTAQILGYEITTEQCNDDTVDSWAKEAVEYTLANGIMYGKVNGFAPKDNITKQEAIITMLRLYKNEGKKEVKNESYNYEMIRQEFETYTSDDVLYNTSIVEYPVFFGNTEIEKLINKKMYEYADRFNKMPEKISESYDDIKGDYFDDSLMLPFIDNERYEVTYNKNGYISILGFSYMWSGGAHAYHAYTGEIYNAATGETVDLSDLEKEFDIKDYLSCVKYEFESDSFGTLEINDIKNLDSTQIEAICMTDGGICLYYNIGDSVPRIIVTIPYDIQKIVEICE